MSLPRIASMSGIKPCNVECCTITIGVTFVTCNVLTGSLLFSKQFSLFHWMTWGWGKNCCNLQIPKVTLPYFRRSVGITYYCRRCCFYIAWYRGMQKRKKVPCTLVTIKINRRTMPCWRISSESGGSTKWKDSKTPLIKYNTHIWVESRKSKNGTSSLCH